MTSQQFATTLTASNAGARALFDELAADISLLHGDDLERKRSQIWKEYAEGRLTDEQASHLTELLTARSGGAERKPAAIAPVRRESWRKGREAGFWRPLTAKDADDLMTAARRFDETQRRETGGRIGPLGPIGLEVLRLMVNTARLHRGHLYPSLIWIMDKLRRSKSAVVAALAALRAHGFLDWRRRYEPTSNEGRGPQVRQISNAYRLIPETARKILGMFVKPSPPPSDEEQRRQEREAEIASFEKFERESVQRSETESSLYSYARKRADGLLDRQLFRPPAGLADGRWR